MNESVDLKQRVRQHWEHEVCGSRYSGEDDLSAFFEEVDRRRYEQEPHLKPFANFDSSRGKRVLEVGLGTGADFANWVRAGAEAHGRDLTDAAVAMTLDRFKRTDGSPLDVKVGDAEALDFPDNYFDIYYAWGVLHHTPNPSSAFAEAYRVLKPGGSLKVMLYHWPSVGAVLVWLLYGPLRGRLPRPRAVYASDVESPGTQMFTVSQAREIVRQSFGDVPVEIRTYLGSGDLLSQEFSEKYQGPLWRLVQRIYPRWFVRLLFRNRFGTVMTVHAVKPG